MSERIEEALRIFTETGRRHVLTEDAMALMRATFARGEVESGAVWDSEIGGKNMRRVVADLARICEMVQMMLDGRPVDSEFWKAAYALATAVSAQRLSIDGPNSPGCPPVPDPPPPDNPDPDAAHVKG